MYEDKSGAFPPLHLPFSVRTLTVMGLILFLGGVISGAYRLFGPEPVYELPPPLKIQEHKEARWNTYRNEEHGFEMKYPSNFQIDQKVLDLGGPVSLNNFDSRYGPGGILPPGGAEITIQKEMLEGTIDARIAEYELGAEIKFQTDALINNRYAREVRAVLDYGPYIEERTTIYISYYGFLYRISLTYHPDSTINAKPILDNFHQILSTFRFIEP